MLADDEHTALLVARGFCDDTRRLFLDKLEHRFLKAPNKAEREKILEESLEPYKEGFLGKFRGNDEARDIVLFYSYEKLDDEPYNADGLGDLFDLRSKSIVG